MLQLRKSNSPVKHYSHPMQISGNTEKNSNVDGTNLFSASMSLKPILNIPNDDGKIEPEQRISTENTVSKLGTIKNQPYGY